jgi:hypothetical protein
MTSPNTSPASNDHPPHAAAAPGPIGQIEQLLAQGKCKLAVELAKEHHKRTSTPDSQRLLVRVYMSRIDQFYSKGMPKEAQALLELVQQRFPNERHQMAGLEIRAAAAAGRLHDLLRPLALEQTSSEVRSLIEQTIARSVTDLAALAACDALPQAHPLRTGAAAIWNAFVAVTAGPVDAAAIDLPEISRRSPLAAWKMLIRAISLFYLREDDACRRALDAIPTDSAIAPLAAELRSAVDGKKPAAGIASVFFSRVLAEDEPLREAMDKIELSHNAADMRRLLTGVREALRACSVSRPELLEQLKVRIVTQAMAFGAPIDEVLHLVGTVRKDASFWRLFARATQSSEAASQAALGWGRFLRHGVAEGMFTESSAEAEAIWLRIAQVLSSMSLTELEDEAQRMVTHRAITGQYDRQPAEIAALRPESDAAAVQQILGPGMPYQHAVKIRPDGQTFAKWWDWSGRVKMPDKQREDIAVRWSQSRPADVQPLLYLSTLAEERSAFSMAIKRLAQAEAIDPLNQQVRRARVRLMLAITWRHFADRKAHLVEKDCADLAALAGMTEGDRAAVLESIRGAMYRLRGDSAAEAASFQAVLERMGPFAGTALFGSIAKAARQARDDAGVLIPDQSQAVEVAQAMARLVVLGEDLRLKLFLPAAWSSPIATLLGARPCPLSHPQLLAIGRGAILDSDMQLAYLASSAGLSRVDSPATTARFLLLRARSLKQYWQVDRLTQCLRAALELARQAHDEELIAEVFSLIDADAVMRQKMAATRDGQGLTPDVLRLVVEKEREAQTMPKRRSGDDPFIVEEARLRARGFFDMFDGDFDAGFDDDDSDSDDDEDDSDDADSEDDDHGNFLFEALPAQEIPSPAEQDRFAEALHNKGIDTPQQLLNNPKSVIDAMAKALGMNLGKAERETVLQQFLQEVGGQTSAGSNTESGGGSKNKKKKRRR